MSRLGPLGFITDVAMRVRLTGSSGCRVEINYERRLPICSHRDLFSVNSFNTWLIYKDALRTPVQVYGSPDGKRGRLHLAKRWVFLMSSRFTERVNRLVSGPVQREDDRTFAVEVQVSQREAAHSRWWFLTRPRWRTLSKPKMRLRMRNGCSTLARTLDVLQFFEPCYSSRL